MEYNFIKTEQQDFVFNIRLSRPEKRNAFTPTMINEIWHAVQESNKNDAIKVVVVSAEAPTFCAGMDLKVFRGEKEDTPNPALDNQEISLGEVFDKLEKPSIALVEGDVIAGGFLIILGCTYVFADEHVKFRLPEVEVGLFPFQVLASLLKVMPERQLCNSVWTAVHSTRREPYKWVL